MANPYINQQEQSLYEGFLNQRIAEEESKKLTARAKANESRLNHFIYLRQNRPDDFRSAQLTKSFNNIDATYEDENINGRNVTVARVNNAEDYYRGARGYYDSGQDYVVAPRGIPLIKGSQESSQKTLDHELIHASRRDQLLTPGTYKQNVRWEDQPEEVFAEAGALEKFKQRLQAMGIKYTPEMGSRYLLDIQRGTDVSNNHSPVRGKPNTIPKDEQLYLYGPKWDDPLSPSNRNFAEPLTNPQNRLKDIIAQREAFYSGNNLPPLEVFAEGYKQETDAYRRPLMATQIAYGTHPLLAGKK